MGLCRRVSYETLHEHGSEVAYQVRHGTPDTHAHTMPCSTFTKDVRYSHTCDLQCAYLVHERLAPGPRVSDKVALAVRDVAI